MVTSNFNIPYVLDHSILCMKMVIWKNRVMFIASRWARNVDRWMSCLDNTQIRIIIVTLFLKIRHLCTSCQSKNVYFLKIDHFLFDFLYKYLNELKLTLDRLNIFQFNEQIGKKFQSSNSSIKLKIYEDDSIVNVLV